MTEKQKVDIEQARLDYDLPDSVENYIHRIGRTGRAGKEGVAISLIHSLDRRKLQAIERRVKQSLNVCQIPTRAQIEAAHVDKVQAQVQEALAGERIASFLPIIAKMAEQYDVHTVAAAALQLVYDQTRPAWLDMEEPQRDNRDNNRGDREYDRSSKPRGGNRGGGGAGGKPVLRSGGGGGERPERSGGGGGGRYDRRDNAPRGGGYDRDNRGGYRSEERV